MGLPDMPTPSEVVAAGAKPPSAAKPIGTDLASVYERFEPTDVEKLTWGQQFKKGVESARTQILSKWRPWEELEERVRKTIGLPKTKQTVAEKLETLPGVSGQARGDVIAFDEAVTDKVHALKGPKKAARADFNAYMFIHRTINRLNFQKNLKGQIAERKAELARVKKIPAKDRVPAENEYIKDLSDEIKSLSGRSEKQVGDYTLEQMGKNLDEFKSKMGGERYANLTGASDNFQAQMDKAMRRQVDSGRMSPKVYAQIKAENDFYAPFAIEKYNLHVQDMINRGAGVDTTKAWTEAIKG